MRALILCLADPSRNPRPFRAIRMCLELGFNVEAVSFANEKPLHITRVYELEQPGKNPFQKIARKLTRFLRPFCLIDKLQYGFPEIEKKLVGAKFDLLIVEDIYLLPLAFKCKKQAKIIFDAREYYPAQRSGSFIFSVFDKPYIHYLCKKFLKRCDIVLTVSTGIAEEYKKIYNTDCQLLLSAPDFQDRIPTNVSFPIRMVHHGLANENRRLENMIDVFKNLDERFELDFYLTGNSSYISYLQKKAAFCPRIHFLPPVQFQEIPNMLARYDIGLYLLEPTGFNTEHALPNKFFEFIQARLAIAIGPSPDMAQLVRQYNLGIIGNSFEPCDMAKALNALTPADINRFKTNSDHAARELCWEKEKIKYTSLIHNLTRSDHP